MDGFDGRLFYLILLLLMVGSWVIYDGKRRLGQTLQNALIWVLIFAMVVIGYGYRDVLMSQLVPGTPRATAAGVELSRSNDGHFYASARVNGQPVTFFVDTGATDIVLSRQDAARVGFDPGALAYTGRARTANGEVRTASVLLDEIRFGGLTDRGVRAAVNDGAMDISLLGMRYLERFERIEIRGDRMLLER